MQPDKLEQRPENNCNASFSHCASLRCDYGLLKSYHGNCERCECEDPCAGNECPIDSQCFVDVTDQEGETAYVPICRKLKKPGPKGTPPALTIVSYQDLRPIAREGGIATLRCFATGLPSPSITWKRGGIEVVKIYFQQSFH